MKHYFEKNIGANPVSANAKLSLSALVLLSCMVFEARFAAAQVQPTVVDAANARNHVNKGNYLLTHQQFQAALTEYEQALDCDPANAVAKANIVLVHNNWGILYFHQRKYDEARNEWNESLRLSPSDRNAKNNLLVLKTTLAKLAPSQTKPVNPPAGSTVGEDTNKSTEADSGLSTAVKMNAPKAAGAETATEDNRGVVILSQPSSNASSFIQSNTDAAAISTSGAAIISSPSKNINSNTANNDSSTTSGSAITSSISNPAATKPNTSIYSNAMTTNSGNSPSPFTANPLQSVGNRNAEAINGTSNNDFASNSLPPSPAPSASNTNARATSSPTFATAPVSLTSLEATLGEIEIKVYGSSKKDLPIMQRVERLEQDTNSRVGSGGITDRIQALARTYGI
ncbi:unnamed protein product [Sphagnum balticum]